MISFSRQSEGSAHRGDTSKLARLGTNTPLASARRMAGIKLHITRDEQIQESVMIVIPPSGTCRPTSQFHACLFCHIGKSSVVIVVIKAVLSEIRDVNIRPSVVIIVTDSDAQTPSVVRHSSFVSHICKRPVMIIVQKHGLRSRFVTAERSKG